MDILTGFRFLLTRLDWIRSFLMRFTNKIKRVLAVALALVMTCTLISVDTKAYAAESGEQAVYRLYTPTTGEHLYTVDWHEVETLYTGFGWQFEGVAWYAPTAGTPVFRLFNPVLNHHLYTTDTNEVSVLTSTGGWQLDNNGNPVFYSGGDVAIYRMYNAGLNGLHLLTTDANEYNALQAYGWSQEGVKLSAVREGNTSMEEQVRLVINSKRAALGLSELTATAELQAAANTRVNEVSRYFSHYRLDGVSCFSVLTDNGIAYAVAAEDIAMGQKSAVKVVDTWMNSAPHREPIVSSNYNHIGVGYYLAGSTPYWVIILTN